jgi:5,10-methylenetetrahydromethanopterin reductase
MIQFASNRLDMTGVIPFSESAARIEDLGWHMGLIPCNPLSLRDPYVSLAFAARSTSTLHLGTLLDTPVLRHPSVLAGAISTVASLAPGRVHMGIGIGDTAVRFNGLHPATVNELESAAVMMKQLVTGQAIEVGAMRPAKLREANDVPIWIAAQGPKTLRMAGRVADGVWIRLGRHPDNLNMAWDSVCEGAREAGRDPGDLMLGLIFHTVYSTNPEEARLMAKSMAAGYYEYSPFLFDRPGFEWRGEEVHILREKAWPDFHHHTDPVYSGRLVDFLDDAVADAFALYGNWEQIAEQLQAVLDLGLPVTHVIPHPVLAKGQQYDFVAACARQLIPHFS